MKITDEKMEAHQKYEFGLGMQTGNSLKIRTFQAFAGYDSQLLALERLKRDFPSFDYECVGWCEIDKYAIQAHNALFPELADKNYGDICKIDWEQVPDFDLFTMSSPCQDFSVAGKRQGGEENSGTRSSLLWECRKAIVTKRPKYILFENVKNLVSESFRPGFMKWQSELASYGYSNFAQVLNAKDYGVPQNRERIFMVSILDFDGMYHFPKKIPLTLCLRDVLEDEPSNKYYLSDKAVEGFIRHKERHEELGHGFGFKPTSGGGVACAVKTSGRNRSDDNYIDERYYLPDKTVEAFKARNDKTGQEMFKPKDRGGCAGAIIAGEHKRGTTCNYVEDDRQD